MNAHIIHTRTQTPRALFFIPGQTKRPSRNNTPNSCSNNKATAWPPARQAARLIRSTNRWSLLLPRASPPPGNRRSPFSFFLVFGHQLLLPGYQFLCCRQSLCVRWLRFLLASTASAARNAAAAVLMAMVRSADKAFESLVGSASDESVASNYGRRRNLDEFLLKYIFSSWKFTIHSKIFWRRIVLVKSGFVDALFRALVCRWFQVRSVLLLILGAAVLSLFEDFDRTISSLGITHGIPMHGASQSLTHSGWHFVESTVEVGTLLRWVATYRSRGPDNTTTYFLNQTSCAKSRISKLSFNFQLSTINI